jgi:hypothetical protein
VLVDDMKQALRAALAPQTAEVSAGSRAA